MRRGVKPGGGGKKEFYPDADVYGDYRDVLKRGDIEVVDIATHPPERAAIIEAALTAGKHVLSQKPFVLDLDVGLRLADLADQRRLRLAVNQNGRWAPHFSYIGEAIQAGLLGQVTARIYRCIGTTAGSKAPSSTRSGI